jgi:hypothetical protein
MTREVLDLPDGSFVDWSIRTPTGRRVEIGWRDGPAVMVDVPELEFDAWHDTLAASPVAAAAWVAQEWEPRPVAAGHPYPGQQYRHGWIPVAVHEEILHLDAGDVQSQLHHDGSILLTVHPDQPPHPQHGDLRDHWHLHTEDVPDLVDGLDQARQRAEDANLDPITVPTTGGDVDLTPRRDGGVDVQFGPVNDLSTLRLAPADVEHLSSHLDFLAQERTPSVAQTVDVSPTLSFDLLSTHRVGIRLGGSDQHEATTLTQDDVEGVEAALRRFAAQAPHEAAPGKKPGLLGRMLGRKAPALEPGGAEREEVASQRLRPGLSVSWWSDGSASIEATGADGGLSDVHIPAGQVQDAAAALAQLLARSREVAAASGHHVKGQPFHFRHWWIPRDDTEAGALAAGEKLAREEEAAAAAKKAAAEAAYKARADAESALLKDPGRHRFAVKSFIPSDVQVTDLTELARQYEASSPPGYAFLAAANSTGTTVQETLDRGRGTHVDRVRFGSGHDGIATTYVTVEMADSDQLSARLGRTIGAPSARVLRTGTHQSVSDYLPGSTWAEVVDRIDPGGKRTITQRRSLASIRDHLLRSDNGVRLGLLDLLTGNESTRDPSTVVILPNSSPASVQIGHGWSELARPGDAPAGSHFVGIHRPGYGQTPAELKNLGPSQREKRFLPDDELLLWSHFVRNGEWVDNPLTEADVAWLRERLTSLEPEFTTADRQRWYAFTLARLEAIAAHARGDRNLFAPDTGARGG